MPKQALSQLPVGKAIIRVLVHFLQEIEYTEFDETLHKLANILQPAYSCFDCINVSRCSYTKTFICLGSVRSHSQIILVYEVILYLPVAKHTSVHYI